MNVTYKELLDAGVHYGHLKRKWNPKMAPYIFMERNGIHVIDLNKTLTSLTRACEIAKGMTRDGRKIMFVATKKQAREIVSQEATRIGMPFVTERWLGGMLTNFNTVKKSLKKLSSIDKMMKSESYQNLAKRERLMISRQKEKLERILGGIANENRLPSAIFVVDISREHIAVKEARKLNIPVFALVDTNSDPSLADYAIPGNDDAYKSIALITRAFSQAIEVGLNERKQEREENKRKEEESKKKAMDQNPEAAEVAEAMAAKQDLDNEATPTQETEQ
ncbi:MAG: 30S ribosomal protein S2 [Bernardetiaceae bacterium]